MRMEVSLCVLILIGFISSYHGSMATDPEEIELPVLDESYAVHDESEKNVVYDEPKKCETIIDIGFILDSSGSVSYYYQDEKNFLKSLSRVFGVSKGATHVGVTTFSSGVELSIKLGQYKDQSSFEAAVNKIRLLGHLTRIDKALKYGWKQMFSESNGARRHVPKLMVLITDGSQTHAPGAVNPASVAKEIRKAGINTLVIGIGSHVDKDELSNIGGGKSKWYNAKNWAALKSAKFLKKMGETICKAAKKELRCKGEDNGCCTSRTPCNIGEGDCDTDDECAGSLVCGNDNCPWGDNDDCCIQSRK